VNVATAGACLDDTLLALADPTRRAILERLSRGEARVTDIAEPFPISLNSVSKHIRLLERAGLVRRTVRGREHLLSLEAQPLDEAAAWIETQRSLWTHRLRTLDALLRAEDREQHHANHAHQKQRGKPTP
jgi:DNA-binding transcriptional ArsR family regulator